jgi:GxxExxY protein
MLYEDITRKILEACFEVSNELGVGYIESVYEKALMVALSQKGLKVQRQVALQVKFRGVVVGDFSVDILVEDKILIELKVVSVLAKELYAQALNYLKATGIEVGHLVNFGNPKVEYRRFDNKFEEKKNILDNLLS